METKAGMPFPEPGALLARDIDSHRPLEKNRKFLYDAVTESSEIPY